MKVYNQVNPNWVNLSKMKDGDVAVIRLWHQDNNSLGEIIHRFKDTILFPGKISERSYPTLTHSAEANNGECMVEILKPGTLLQL